MERRGLRMHFGRHLRSALLWRGNAVYEWQLCCAASHVPRWAIMEWIELRMPFRHNMWRIVLWGRNLVYEW